MNLLEVFIASLQNLKVNKVRSFLTMLGVIIGVTSVILLVSIGQGAKIYINEQFASLGTNLLIITPGKIETKGGPPLRTESVEKLTFEDSMALKRRAFLLKGVVPFVLGNSTVKYSNRSRSVIVAGVNNEYQWVRGFWVEIGSFVSDDDVEARRRVVVIGKKVVEELFGTSNPIAQMVKIGDVKFRVIGIMEKKGVSLGIDFDNVVFIPVKTAQDLFNTQSLFQIIVSVISEKELNNATDQIISVLKKRHNNKEDFTIVSQGAMLSTLDTILNVLTYVLGGIAGISLIVGGIGIMNIMLVSIKERTREIGIRKAVGAKKKDILIQFLIESITISTAGGIIGILLGIGGAAAAHKIFPALPTKVTPWAIIIAFVFSVSVGVFFGVYPAKKASELDTIESLRYE